MEIVLNPRKESYKRIKYGIFNLLGELGGVAIVVKTILGYLFYRIC